MAANLKVEGLDELRKTLTRDAVESADSILRQTVYGIAQEVCEDLKRRVKKRSRALHDSLVAVRRRGSKYEFVSEVRGGHGAPYMLMLEYGTSRTRAQPFIEPGTEAMRPRLPEIYTEQFGKKLEKSLARAQRAKAKASA